MANKMLHHVNYLLRSLNGVYCVCTMYISSFHIPPFGLFISPTALYIFYTSRFMRFRIVIASRCECSNQATTRTMHSGLSLVCYSQFSHFSQFVFVVSQISSTHTRAERSLYESTIYGQSCDILFLSNL